MDPGEFESDLPPMAGKADDGNVSGTSGVANGSDTSANTNTQVWRPAPGTSWQWQLQGTLDTSHDVQMYDVDLFDTSAATISELHAAGRRVVCYFSAGTREDWRSDVSGLPGSVIGNELGEWPGENWWDIRSEAVRDVIRGRLDLAASKGCDGVEPDNVDGYTNNPGLGFDAGDQLDFNKWMAGEAHSRNLSIGLKNDLDQVAELEPYFDWALNEQCVQYNECEKLLPFVEAGKAVFGVEYEVDTASACAKANSLNFDWLIKTYDLGPERTACR